MKKFRTLKSLIFAHFCLKNLKKMEFSKKSKKSSKLLSQVEKRLNSSKNMKKALTKFRVLGYSRESSVFGCFRGLFRLWRLITFLFGGSADTSGSSSDSLEFREHLLWIDYRGIFGIEKVMADLLIMFMTEEKKNIFEQASHSSILLKILYSVRENHR